MATMTMNPAPAQPAPSARFGLTDLVRHDLVVRGDLDATTSLNLRGRVSAATLDGPALILVDVTGVTSVTASGLAGVIELLRLARSRGCDLRLWGGSTTVLDAALVADLTTITRVYGGRQAAIEASRTPVPARASTMRKLGTLRLRGTRTRTKAVPAQGAAR